MILRREDSFLSLSHTLKDYTPEFRLMEFISFAEYRGLLYSATRRCVHWKGWISWLRYPAQLVMINAREFPRLVRIHSGDDEALVAAICANALPPFLLITSGSLTRTPRRIIFRTGSICLKCFHLCIKNQFHCRSLSQWLKQVLLDTTYYGYFILTRELHQLTFRLCLFLCCSRLRHTLFWLFASRKRWDCSTILHRW